MPGFGFRRQFGTVAAALLVLLAAAIAALTTAQSAQAAICSARREHDSRPDARFRHPCLRWAFSLPANSSIAFTYTLAVSTTITNSVVGTVGGLEIGASSGTGNEVSVDPTAPVVTTATLPNATAGSSYSQALTATAGTGSYTWTIASGLLPTGLTLAATGVISGIPTSAGTSTFTVTATDGTPTSGSKSLTLTVGAAVSADVTAPTGSLTLAGGASATSSTTLALGLSATDATGVVGYRVAEGSDCTSASWVAVTSSTSFSGTASLTVSAGDGAKTACVEYQDAAGNVSTRRHRRSRSTRSPRRSRWHLLRRAL
jgi:hypothetical protein